MAGSQIIHQGQLHYGGPGFESTLVGHLRPVQVHDGLSDIDIQLARGKTLQFIKTTFVDSAGDFHSLQHRPKIDNAEQYGLLSLWQFPDAIVRPIRHQYSQVSGSDPYRYATNSLTLTAFAAKHLPKEPFEPDHLLASFTNTFPEQWKAMEVSEEEVTDIFERARAAYQTSIEAVKGS